MSTAIDILIERVEELERRTDEVILGEVRKNEAVVVKLNVDDQMYNGLNGNGQKIRPPYKPSTIKQKRRKGQPHDRVTLRDTGEFHGSFLVKYGDGEFAIDADDPKRIWLLRKYGKDIFGLTDESVQKLLTAIREDTVTALQKVILQ